MLMYVSNSPMWRLIHYNEFDLEDLNPINLALICYVMYCVWFQNIEINYILSD